MAKRRWLSLIKRFFISETCQNRSKEKKRKWVFGRHKLKRLTSQAALIERPQVVDRVKTESENVVQEVDEPKKVGDKEWENGAAIKIQTTFRGFLARKALRALKGLVKLQAIIRGHLVRHQAVTTLKRLQSVVNIQSQACAKRVLVVDCTSHNNYQDYGGKDIKIDMNSQKRWDDSILTKEEENALLCSKREAAMKRERIKEYAYNHRMSSESEQSKVNGKYRYWLEQWVDTQLAKREDLQNIRKKEDFESHKVKLRNLKSIDTPTYPPRTPHHRKQRSYGEEHCSSITGSPVVPTYMAATQSARAKSRSLSSPSMQVWNANNRVGFSQRSPSLKGVPGHVKPSRNTRNLSFNSECSLPNLDQPGHFR
uniref:DUF4005 domain-containing protein n=1 Tax=Tanacetum cinerariifolium TaxID=118510 RepID=A0A6L2LBC8_TANCI|nr:hypothetical protein [Tanacetum cinerariifolium]